MKKLILRTDENWSGFVTRVTIGLVIFPHGAQKVFGWFGGPGYQKEMIFFIDTLSLPWIIAFLVILIEFLGALSLIIGFASRIWATAMIILFTGMILMEHKQYGFFMNWFGNQRGEGFEYHLLIIGLSLATLISGGGKYSLDFLITKEKKSFA
ncbi:DoxX family protein [Pedobacter heparinus]|uniref:DoxX family protein n=1 Tax=Pedobacter heparinus (strain ATCC 13125 / DSM 2366 / CIP 104194 / JCM 7457 / NBRC 12017 / NCIMB 9290 / NRRL B-14731 / HIM 762-3) TaxID=485917 RepID=C6XVB8_PEDHD|nr:DoxX family protein [Pedobacter heparinus]ACU03984.1 DoxX family protein [Pedobacter heparinus DSM 2366]